MVNLQDNNNALNYKYTNNAIIPEKSMTSLTVSKDHK